jgi:hypothetical protein
MSTSLGKAADDLVLRPIKRSRQGSQWGAAAVWALCSVAFLVRFHGVALLLVGAGSLLAAIAMLLWLRWLLRHSQLALRGRTLYWGTPRERPVFEVGQPGEIVEFTLDSGRGLRESWCLLDHEGRSKVFIYKSTLEADQLTELEHRLRLSVTRRERRYSLQEANKEFPGIVPRWLARPQLLGVAVGLGLIVFITAVALALGAK